MSYSLIMSILWILLESPDLAITEAAVGAGNTTVLFLVTLKKIHAMIKPEEEEGETEDEQKNEEGLEPTGAYKVTMSDGLNLRTEPSVSGGDDTVILEIPYGATVEVLEFNSDFSWAYVEYEDEGAEGWVSAKNIEYIG